MSDNAPVDFDLEQSWRDEWGLDPETAFCNHGSFGATPTAVLDHQQELREVLERDPVRFFARDYEELLDEARTRLAEFLGASSEGLVFVPNATTGVNTALAALDLQGGDEILVTDHGYEACVLAAERRARQAGAGVSVARLPDPCVSPADLTAAIIEATTGQTRIAVIDHVTSPTGLVMPVADIVGSLNERGVHVIVDGAHGPGQVDVGLDPLGASVYTGNCHKWLCAPKGAGFMWVRDDLRDRMAPLVTSHGERHRRPGRSHLHDRFDWTGTADPTPYLTVPTAIDHLDSLLDGGWPAIRERNRELALAGRSLLIGIGMQPVGGEDLVGSMAALTLPHSMDIADTHEAARRLGTWLYDEHQVQVPVTWRRSGALAVRLSAHLHTSLEDFRRVKDAVLAMGR